jgi:alpha-D-xyloside xylohydrolase
MGGFFRPSDQYTSLDYHNLLVRWFQFGSFTPLYRVHGGGSNTEIWNYGPTVEQLLNATNNLRYRLLPYTYTGFARCAMEGYTMQRAMVMDYGIDFSMVTDQFMWGDNVLVAPVVTRADNNALSRNVVFPDLNRGDWIDFWTGETINVATSGSRSLNVSAPIEASPLFIKSGTVLTLGPMKQYVSEKPQDPLEIRIYSGSDGLFTLYEDDGTSRDYMDTKAYTNIEFHWNDAESTLTIGDIDGSFDGMLQTRTFEIVLVKRGHGAGLQPETAPDKVVTYIGAKMDVKI